MRGDLGRLHRRLCARRGARGGIDGTCLAHSATLRRAAHTLKSSADVFGARRVVDLSWRLEQLARAGDLSAAGPVAAELKQAAGALAEELRGVVRRSALTADAATG